MSRRCVAYPFPLVQGDRLRVNDGVTAPHSGLPSLAKWLFLAGGLLLAPGCARNEIPPPTQPGPLDGMPAASSPEGAVNAFRWCNENLSTEGYRLLFTADFRFAFATLDTNGNVFRGDAWVREHELGYFGHLVNGGAADQPAASLLTLVLDRSFRVQNDTRTGKYDPERRKTITTQVNLTIQTVDGVAVNVNGKATFFLVRGDSARVPEDLGLGADPNRWYIERWEDQTFAPTGSIWARSSAARPLHAQPSKNATWGSIKALYF